ncbi:DinB family protein [Flavihumibacter fluvii]|uniref:DinB family protein n=1 Tax=Flavihumibacter fluvii TaxID=2838157 RepID=UPI001BDEFD75|nr:DinB family protein [Flavihumibacter fluvii]ULQ51325.1 hypothetical protein KJS93_14640 [Flavihumibacter fluvii]
MKAFFHDLINYNHHFNQAITTVVDGKTEKVSEKAFQLLSHIINVHQIWNLKIQLGQAPFDPWQVHPKNDLKELDRQNFELSNQLLEAYALTHSIQWSTKNGQVFTNTLQDIFFQIINHSTYHRGQIATEFRQIGLEPLLSDFIYYKMTNG